jgi:hypothetical protein
LVVPSARALAAPLRARWELVRWELVRWELVRWELVRWLRWGMD